MSDRIYPTAKPPCANRVQRRGIIHTLGHAPFALFVFLAAQFVMWQIRIPVFK